MRTRTIKIKSYLLALILTLGAVSTFAQTNVFDDVIATSSNHTYLKAALEQEGLDVALRTLPNATVFAPDDDAFTALADALNTDIAGLLALNNLGDILEYHVLGSTVLAADITNGDIATALSSTNDIKLTKTGMGSVYANHAMVTTADLTADNGVVHVVDAVLLPDETVIDVAIDNNFTTLITAVTTAELLPVLTNPLEKYTVFAPTNDAFDALATELNTDISGLLALNNLADILTYHVLGAEVASGDIGNGDVVNPVSTTNTLKLTVTSMSEVYVNQAKVTLADVTADNGIVHAIDAVVLPNETVVDVAIDNGFTSLVSAVITAELVPTLTNPFEEYTVFAPDNAAFDQLATDLNTDLNGILARQDLADILTYHVVSGTVLSGDLQNGSVTTLNSEDVMIDISSGVMVNTATVTTADIEVDNGVVHEIDQVLLPSSVTSARDVEDINIDVYPNPASNSIALNKELAGDYTITAITGSVVAKGTLLGSTISVADLPTGTYILTVYTEGTVYRSKFIKK